MKSILWMLLPACLTLLSLNASADVQCFVKDKRGHMWASEGSTEDRATAVAKSFCTAYSPDKDTCEFSRCIGYKG